MVSQSLCLDWGNFLHNLDPQWFFTSLASVTKHVFVQVPMDRQFFAILSKFHQITSSLLTYSKPSLRHHHIMLQVAWRYKELLRDLLKPTVGILYFRCLKDFLMLLVALMISKAVFFADFEKICLNRLLPLFRTVVALWKFPFRWDTWPFHCVTS